jgi:hypothetical protein
VYSNTASHDGGGLSIVGGSVAVNRSYVSGNRAERGGGAGNFDRLILVNTTVSGNHAEDDGGGVYNDATLVLSNTTVALNVAGAGSGGVSNQAPAYARNTIIAGNQPDNCVDDPFESRGYNLEDGDGCGFDGTGDQPETDPKLEPLAEDRGTWVHALLEDSPAIDAGLCVADITVDQRGVSRPQGSASKCDVGAYELKRAMVYLPVVLRNP